MLPIADAVAALGARHGLLLEPGLGRVRVLRFDRFEQMPVAHLRVGLRLWGRTVELPLAPLTPGRERFAFVDQRLGVATSTLIGIDPESGLRLRLTLASPFLPRDREASTFPGIALEAQVDRLPGAFRWQRPTQAVEEVELFVAVEGLAAHAEDGVVYLSFESIRRHGHWTVPERPERLPQTDALVAEGAELVGTAFVRRLRPAVGQRQGFVVHWLTWSPPVLEVEGERWPFAYAERYPDLAAVIAAVRADPSGLLARARRVDAVLAGWQIDQPIRDLLCYTLHSWLICTWWARRAGRDWFSVWEGNCFFHSTVDVEFTQAPFYLALWPELLALQLEQWTQFTKPTSAVTGRAADPGRFFQHDIGSMAAITGGVYPHDMPVEETANWLVLMHAYHRRSGDDRLLRRHRALIHETLAFLAAVSDGEGVPVQGVSNTVDDGSPAIQYGEAQVYLAVKTLGALVAAAAMLEHLGDPEAAACRQRAERLRAAIERDGWAGDHYRVLLRRSGTLRDPWTGRTTQCADIPGWDRCHIYTANVLPPLDQVGTDIGLDSERLRTDLRTATRACLREYGCLHTDYDAVPDAQAQDAELARLGLAGSSGSSGWIAMNLARDLAAARRGLDLRHLAARYWAWQVLTNAGEGRLFFETFGGNNLSWYPRGVVVWGYAEALADVVIDRVAGVRRWRASLSGAPVPLFCEADWRAGTVPLIGG
ncbi:MAG: DUF4965 domain-containing protein [Planctomycetota bacterium]|nr:DUF4965 domain-containing protein [Planctomycetota bacterium]MDW8372352.1 DUF4965 domain-containing protein [Planctomycetota bacterium]